jgi:hypothetical protein
LGVVAIRAIGRELSADWETDFGGKLIADRGLDYCR